MATLNDNAPLLDVQRLAKRFGGVVASAGIDLQVRAGEVHALIGPNGAGKTTLIAQLAGQLRPDSGRIIFAGDDITRLAPHQRARRGLARSFQITRLFRSFDVQGNFAAAVTTRAQHLGGELGIRPCRRDGHGVGSGGGRGALCALAGTPNTAGEVSSGVSA